MYRTPSGLCLLPFQLPGFARHDARLASELERRNAFTRSSIGDGRVEHHENHRGKYGSDRGGALRRKSFWACIRRGAIDHGEVVVHAPSSSTNLVTRCSSLSSFFKSRSVKRKSSAGPVIHLVSWMSPGRYT